MHPQEEARFSVALRHHATEVASAIGTGDFARARAHAQSVLAVVEVEEKKHKEAREEAKQRAAQQEATARQATLRWLHEKEGLCAAMLAANPGLSPEDITLCHDSTSGTTRVWAEIKKRR